MVWAVIGKTTLTSAANNISVSGLTAKQHLVVEIYIKSVGGGVDTRLTFNNTTGSEYSTRRNFNGASDGTSNSLAHIEDLLNSGQGSWLIRLSIFNKSDKEKLVISRSVSTGSASGGAGTAPDRADTVGKWANTSASISTIKLATSSNNFDTGSEMVVWGDDGTDAGQSTIPNGSIHEESDTGKHKIWNSTTSTWTEIA